MPIFYTINEFSIKFKHIFFPRSNTSRARHNTQQDKSVFFHEIKIVFYYLDIFEQKAQTEEG